MRRLIQVALLLLLLVHLAGAPFETVDHWDNFAQGGDDLVLSVLSVVAGLGLTLAIAYLLRSALRAVSQRRGPRFIILPQIAKAFLQAERPAPLTSPPLFLRI